MSVKKDYTRTLTRHGTFIRFNYLHIRTLICLREFYFWEFRSNTLLSLVGILSIQCMIVFLHANVYFLIYSKINSEYIVSIIT